MRRTWLIFSQAVTVALALLFVVGTLKPEWLPRRAPAPSLSLPAPVGTAVQPASLGAGPYAYSYAAAARRAAPSVVSIAASHAAQRNARSEDPWFRFFFGDRSSSDDRLFKPKRLRRPAYYYKKASGARC